MYRTHNCGELRIENLGQNVKLCGWVQLKRDKGGMIWIDLRDRYGITQLVFEKTQISNDLLLIVSEIHREYVLQVEGEVIERYSKNDKIPTGDIEIKVNTITILNKSETPPFTIIDDTYNANPESVKSSLDVLKNFNQRTKKILVLGDMFELGKESETLHKNLAVSIDKIENIEVYTIGKETEKLSNELKKAVAKKHFRFRKQLTAFMEKLIIEDSVILLKGSRGLFSPGLRRI